MIADSRLAALRFRLAEEGLQAFLVTGIPNVRYITGFEDVFDDDANVACLVTGEIAWIYTDGRYSEAAEGAAVGTTWVLHVAGDNLYVELCDHLSQRGVAELVVESSVPYGRFRFLSERFGGNIHVLEHWIEEIRRTKETAEIERIAAAAAVTDRAFEYVRGFLKVGMRECDVALELEVFMRKNGSRGLAFDPIVASGSNSSRPHAQASEREIATGDLVTMDFGARVGGYCADMTRTVVMGPASERQSAVYEAVLAANRAGIAAVRAGLPGSEVDARARGVLVEKGLGEYFTHGLGHGVGLEVHELPSVSPRGRQSLPAGAVVTVEPGVYIPGFGGVRIEDLVVVEETGCRVLTASPVELLEL